MRHTAASWKAVDVLSDGKISQVAVQRSDFHSLLASGGVPALQAGLQRKVASLSNGELG
jgi:ABC-type transporter MlaC component